MKSGVKGDPVRASHAFIAVVSDGRNSLQDRDHRRPPRRDQPGPAASSRMVELYSGPAMLYACLGSRCSHARHRMAKKLKTYQTSLGFFDQAIAAPSMKAALKAWGADSNLFHQGAAKESDDPGVIAATMAKPGVVLRRPVGTGRPFSEHAELPTDLVGGGPTKAGRKSKRPKANKSSSRPVDKAAERKAALAYEREQRARDLERAREEAARQKERERRQRAIDKAQAALDKAEQEHEESGGDPGRDRGSREE